MIGSPSGAVEESGPGFEGEGFPVSSHDVQTDCRETQEWKEPLATFASKREGFW